MNTKDLEIFAQVKWDQVLFNEDDISNYLKKLHISELNNVKILSRTVLKDDDRLSIVVSAEGENNKHYKIILDATSGIPTWKQFIDVTYDKGNSADIKIILYGTDFREHSYAGAFSK